MKTAIRMQEAKKEKKQRISGITQRWFRSTLLTVLIVYFIMAITIFFIVRNYYYSSVEMKLNSQFNSSVSNFFTQSGTGGDFTFEDRAQAYIQNYDQKDKVEVWIINSEGNVIDSSSGFSVEPQYIPDYEQALRSSTHSAQYTGKDAGGEKIMAETFLISDGTTNRSAVRYIVSLKEVDRQLVMIMVMLLMVYIILFLLAMFSGSYFINSIINPIGQINEGTKKMAAGDMDARIEPQEYQDEISELASNINKMADEVNSTDKMKNDFISTVSHEMKTPLTAIQGWAETMQAVGDSDPALTKRGLEVIVSESERLTGVVNDLLDLSKLASGRLTLRYEKIDSLAELDQTVYLFKERSMREGIELNYNAPNIPAPAEGDPDRIDQVFVNILDNAFKYNHQGGKITVLAEVLPPKSEDDKKTELRIYVEDTGCGIAQEELPKIRKKFYKSNISVSGSGIGLAVVDEIVKMHHGSMDIQSELGSGTCVILKFPVDYVKVEPPAIPDLPEAASSQEDQLEQKTNPTA